MSAPLPASHTKDLPTLHHAIPRSTITLRLRQVSSQADGHSSTSTGTTGTTLWLSSQLLSCYVLSLPPPSPSPSPSTSSLVSKPVQSLSRTQLPTSAPSSTRPTMLDLGSGIGYLPLCLASKGYDVIATDISDVIESVLRDNIDNGLRAIYASSTPVNQIGSVEVVELDWEVVAGTGALPDLLQPMENSELHSERKLDPLMERERVREPAHQKGRRIDIITTTDTLYAPHLVQPLLKTLRLISDAQASPPVVYIGLERRDSRLVDSALRAAMDAGLGLKKIGRGRVEKSLSGTGWGWSGEDWEGVEIWKGKFKALPTGQVD